MGFLARGSGAWMIRAGARFQTAPRWPWDRRSRGETRTSPAGPPDPGHAPSRFPGWRFLPGLVLVQPVLVGLGPAGPLQRQAGPRMGARGLAAGTGLPAGGRGLEPSQHRADGQQEAQDEGDPPALGGPWGGPHASSSTLAWAPRTAGATHECVIRILGFQGRGDGSVTQWNRTMPAPAWSKLPATLIPNQPSRVRQQPQSLGEVLHGLQGPLGAEQALDVDAPQGWLRCGGGRPGAGPRR